MRGMGVESEDGEGSERAVLKRRRRRAMGVWARQEATVIHRQGIGQERQGRGVLLDGTPGSHFVQRNSLTSDGTVLGAAMKVSL